jgi:hypothetical protein
MLCAEQLVQMTPFNKLPSDRLDWVCGRLSIELVRAALHPSQEGNQRTFAKI